MQLLKAFAWLQWRLIANGIRAAERRDTFEKISRVTALLAPGLLLASAVASIVGATAAGAVAGWQSVTHPLDNTSVPQVVRVLLLVVMIVAAFVPLFVGTRGGAARFTRLLLLPIPRARLHFAEVATTLCDPWLAFVPPGLLAFGGATLLAALTRPEAWQRALAWAGVVEIIGAVGVTLVLASLSALVAFLVSWIVRDRRRHELFIIVLVLALALVSTVPAMLSSRLEHGDRTIPAISGAESGSRLLPSELYFQAVRAAQRSDSTRAMAPLAGLFVEGGLLYALSAVVHRRLLEAMQSAGGVRSRRAARPAVSRRIPGLWPGTSAVAIAQMRTALRSVRGRLVVLLPGPLVAMLALAFGRLDTHFNFLTEGYALLACGIVFGLYAAQPFTMNQFGSDRAGLTLEFLVPVRDVDLIRGKAVGCAAIVGAGVAMTLACALIVAPGGPVFLWLATLEAGAACYLLLAPIAAWFSVLFPVAADLSKTGAGGNPHTLAMLAGMIVVAIAAAPEAGIMLLFSPGAAFVVMTVWTALTWIGASLVLGLVARSLRSRRENLALIAQAR